MNRNKKETSQAPKMVAAYLRVSTSAQDELGNGLTVQRQHIAAYAAANGQTVDVWLTDVESGAKESREALDELRALVLSGQVGTVLLYRIDRLARDNFLAEKLHRELTGAGVKIVSVSESFGEGFTGNLMRQIVQAFAEYERAVIAARLKGGRRESVRKNGTYGGGPGVLGYRPEGKKGEPGKGALKVIEGEAEAVRMVFRLRAEGLTLQQIAGELNRTGHVTKGGAAFSHVQVLRVLRREPFYRGAGVLTLSVSAEKVAHEPIMPG